MPSFEPTPYLLKLVKESWIVKSERPYDRRLKTYRVAIKKIDELHKGVNKESIFIVKKEMKKIGYNINKYGYYEDDKFHFSVGTNITYEDGKNPKCTFGVANSTYSESLKKLKENLIEMKRKQIEEKQLKQCEKDNYVKFCLPLGIIPREHDWAYSHPRLNYIYKDEEQNDYSNIRMEFHKDIICIETRLNKKFKNIEKTSNFFIELNNLCEKYFKFEEVEQ